MELEKDTYVEERIVTCTVDEDVGGSGDGKRPCRSTVGQGRVVIGRADGERRRSTRLARTNVRDTGANLVQLSLPKSDNRVSQSG